MLQHFDAVDVWHANVGDYDVEQRGVEFANCRLAGVDRLHFVALAPQSNIEHFADRALVVADQEIRHELLSRSSARHSRIRALEERWRRRILPLCEGAARTYILAPAWNAPRLCL